ncbi:ribonuclease HII [Altericista sp. CCNU0014]|uniref:ribonuclease HII n=1 Tax=Altericista sp. CCNU0014 TaxID=3082949 RepID=UPI00384DE37D
MVAPRVNEGLLQIAGVDEVGRGALFGPVVAAAVILLPVAAERLVKVGVKDSKQLRAADREILYETIKTHAVAFCIGMASVREIDRMNILQASLLAMRRAVMRLSITPDLCLIDGNRAIPAFAIDQRTIVKGDQREPAIAAASILAKVWRDRLLVRLDRRYPGYHLASNKGYGSRAHQLALETLGPSPQHRLSFSPCQRSLFQSPPQPAISPAIPML